jgi:hypothetical protein
MKILLLITLWAGILAAQTCNLTDDPALILDQSAALQACINGARDYSTITFGSTMPHVRVNQTIRINGRFNLAIECPGGHAMSAGAPGFYWGGASGGTLLNTSGSSAVRIEHCNLFSQDGSNILIDADISSTVGSNVTTTEHLYNDLGLTAFAANPNFVAIRFSASGDANVEAMRVTGTRIQCQGNQGIGIYIAGYTFDAIRHRYSDNQINNCSQGIRALYGLPTITSNHFQSNLIDITALAGPIHIADNDSENASQFFVGSAGTALIVESNRIAACHPPTGQGCINISGSLISRGNTFNALSGMPFWSNSNGIGLLSEGDNFSDYQQFLVGAHSFYQFEARMTGYGIGTVIGGFQGGSAIVFSCNHGLAGQASAPGVFVVCADDYLNKLQVSEDGGAFKNVIP